MKLIELVPRSLSEIRDQALALLKEFPLLDGVNIPDVVRLPHRSHDVALDLAANGILAVPHIRCIDRPLDDTVALARRLVDGGVKHMLVVSGDRPKNGDSVHDVSPIDAIRRIKSEVSAMTVYAGIDPYRSNLKTEVAYIRAKQAAGVDGFFSQPFFDLQLAVFFEQLLNGSPLFIGISPVITEASKTYWETVNQVVFAPDFELTMDHNAMVAAKLSQFADQRNQHVYLMPIKADPVVYLRAMLRHTQS
jgi:methylenetetrahydrofolate reductase (NADPH)